MDTDIFYSYDEMRSSTKRAAAEKRAKTICVSCPVIEQCRESAFSHPERHGIWAATTNRERSFDTRGQRSSRARAA